MKKDERHKLILHEVEVHNRVLLTDLASALKVSPDTIRRDIKELDDLQKLKKVHGGAVSNGYNINGQNTLVDIYAVESKIKIAKKALELIENDSVVLISGGTTNLELIRQLPQKLQATFFTPSLPIAIELLSHPEIEVILIGGRLSKESQIAVGGSALNILSEIKVDICFLGTGYLDPINGLTEFDWEVVQMKKAMINASKKVVSLTISEKLNSRQRYKICEIQAINTLITELDAEDPHLMPYKNQNIEII
ncbi:MAG: DeoR/GlpR transcriptional regulator [Cyclobacteriaceae bacterium]|nr:DeoR/GlpR transcriptional regulator [Cyclobacteriaceae bacterium HetDA_MAG_MS6]